MAELCESIKKEHYRSFFIFDFGWWVYYSRVFRAAGGLPNLIYTFYGKTFMYVTEIYQYVLFCYVSVIPMSIDGVAFLYICTH